MKSSFWRSYEPGEIESLRLLLEMTYVELGMVPPSHYPWDDRGSLQRCLESLEPEARRRACRKFRKFVRKVRQKGWKNPGFHTKQRAVKYKIEFEYVNRCPSDNDE